MTVEKKVQMTPEIEFKGLAKGALAGTVKPLGKHGLRE